MERFSLIENKPARDGSAKSASYSGEHDECVQLKILSEQYELLSRNEEQALGRVIQHPDSFEAHKTAIEHMVRHNIRLAFWMARRQTFLRKLTSYDEMVQAALIGIQNAARRFDPARETTFANFATHHMRGAMQQAASEITGLKWEYVRLYPSLVTIVNQFVRESGRQPEDDELETLTRRKARWVRNVIYTVEAYMNQDSLHRELNPKDKNRRKLQDVMGSVAAKKTLEEIDAQSALSEVVSRMTALECAVLECVLQGDPVADLYHDQPDLKPAVKVAHTRVIAYLRHPRFAVAWHLGAADYEWQRDALCRRTRNEAVLAKAARKSRQDLPCRACPVAAKCRAEATTHSALGRHFIWGGGKA